MARSWESWQLSASDEDGGGGGSDSDGSVDGPYDPETSEEDLDFLNLVCPFDSSPNVDSDEESTEDEEEAPVEEEDDEEEEAPAVQDGDEDEMPVEQEVVEEAVPNVAAPVVPAD